MRILFISKEGDGLGVGQRLALEGHAVDFYVRDPRYVAAGRGLVNRIPSWQSHLRRADLIIADSVGLGRYEEIIRASGRPYLGFSPQLDAIELDRCLGMKLFSNAGVEIAPTLEFHSASEASAACKKEEFGDGWVLKPNGNKSAAQTAVCKRPEMFDRALKALSPQSSGIVQRVVSGIEVSTEGWFNGTAFVEPFNHTFEEKRFLNGDLGCNTGCQGNVVVTAGRDKLVRETVEKIEPFLKIIGYRGPFDINCIVNEDHAYALEATSRFGYDAIEALIEGLEEPASDLFFDIAVGTRKKMKLTDETMISVRLSVGPYPHRQPDSDKPQEPVSGITESNLYHLFLCDVEKKGGDYLTANGDGIVLKATAIGRVDSRPGSKPDYTYDARRRVYRLLDKIDIAGKQYRTDIGTRVNDDIAQLKKWGWLDT